MSQELAQEQVIRSYLLGELPESEQERIEERLVTDLDQDFFDAVLMIESELVDDYALGLISDQERAKLERGLLMSPHEHGKVEFVQTLAQYITDNKAASTWEQLLREAEANRNLIHSLVADDWLGLEILFQLKAVRQASKPELASLVECEDASLATALSRLNDCELIHEIHGQYSCSQSSLETLEKLEDLTQQS